MGNYTPISVDINSKHTSRSNRQLRKTIIPAVLIIGLIIFTGVIVKLVQTTQIKKSVGAQFAGFCESQGGISITGTCPPGTNQININIDPAANTGSAEQTQIATEIINNQICCRPGQVPADEPPPTGILPSAVPITEPPPTPVPQVNTPTPTNVPIKPNDPVLPDECTLDAPCPPGYRCPNNKSENQKPPGDGECKTKGSICDSCVCWECAPEQSGGTSLEFWKCWDVDPLDHSICRLWGSCSNPPDGADLGSIKGLCKPETIPSIPPASPIPNPSTKPMCPNSIIKVDVICPVCQP